MKAVVETGTAKGRSTICWAAAVVKNSSRRDTPSVVTYEPSKDNNTAARENVRQAKFDKIVTFNECKSQIGLLKQTKRDFDLAFIDGEHSFTGCLLDMLLCGHLLKPNGYMVLQDVITQRIVASPEVEEAVLTCDANKWCDVIYINTETGLAIMRKTENWPELEQKKLDEWVKSYASIAHMYRFYYREFVEARGLRDLGDDILEYLESSRACIPLW